ncbi:helix-turn-helix domain-containing protein [Streptomyces sp. NPDC002814]
MHADAETRQTLDTYLREQCSTTRTAERLFTHRNTVLRRLPPADDLLPPPCRQRHRRRRRPRSDPLARLTGCVVGEGRESIGVLRDRDVR